MSSLKIIVLALFTWDINFLCIETTPYAQIQNESGCWISIDYLTNEVCGTFVTSNHLALISVVSVLFVIALLVLAVVMYCCYKKRNYRRVRGDDKSSTPIYLKVLCCNVEDLHINFILFRFRIATCR